MQLLFFSTVHQLKENHLSLYLKSCWFTLF